MAKNWLESADLETGIPKVFLLRLLDGYYLGWGIAGIQLLLGYLMSKSFISFYKAVQWFQVNNSKSKQQ